MTIANEIGDACGIESFCIRLNEDDNVANAGGLAAGLFFHDGLTPVEDELEDHKVTGHPLFSGWFRSRKRQKEPTNNLPCTA